MIPETGPALSAAVGREVMGVELTLDHDPTRLFHPHDDIAQAIEAAEHLFAVEGAMWDVERLNPREPQAFSAGVVGPVYACDEFGDTPAEALCRAMLAFVRSKP